MEAIYLLLAEACQLYEIHRKMCAFCDAECVSKIMVMDWLHMLEQAGGEQWMYHS
jgi:hypothetical protein